MRRENTWRGVLREWVPATDVLATGLLVVGCCLACRGVWAQTPIGVPSMRFQPDRYAATSNNAARTEAIESLPLDKLGPDQRAKVSQVLAEAKIFRRMPLRIIQCDPDLYLFLIRHPDVVVNIWEVLGVSKMQLTQLGPDRFRLIDGEGTCAELEFLHKGHDLHVIYVEGAYNGPLFIKPVHGNGLMILRSGYVREPDGRYYITSRLDTFTHLEPEGAEFLTKTFQPLVGKVADTNFIQTVGFVGSLSRTAELNLRGVQRLATRLFKVDAEVRRQFAQIAQAVAVRAIQFAEHRAVESDSDEPSPLDRDKTTAQNTMREKAVH